MRTQIKISTLVSLFALFGPVWSILNLTIVYVPKNPGSFKTAGPGGQGYMDKPNPEYPPGVGELVDSVLYARHALAVMEIEHHTEPWPYGVDYGMMQWHGTEQGQYLAILLGSGMGDEHQTAEASLALLKNENNVTAAVPVCVDSGLWPIDEQDATAILRDYHDEIRRVVAQRKANSTRARGRKGPRRRSQDRKRPVWVNLWDEE